MLLCRYYYQQLTKGALVAVARRLGTFTVQTVSVCLHNKNIMISQQQADTVEPQMKICIVNVCLRHNKEQELFWKRCRIVKGSVRCCQHERVLTTYVMWCMKMDLSVVHNNPGMCVIKKNKFLWLVPYLHTPFVPLGVQKLVTLFSMGHICTLFTAKRFTVIF